MEEDTGSPFRDMGNAIRFAMEYSVIFRDLVIKTANTCKAMMKK